MCVISQIIIIIIIIIICHESLKPVCLIFQAQESTL